MPSLADPPFLNIGLFKILIIRHLISEPMQDYPRCLPVLYLLEEPVTTDLLLVVVRMYAVLGILPLILLFVIHRNLLFSLAHKPPSPLLVFENQVLLEIVPVLLNLEFLILKFLALLIEELVLPIVPGIMLVPFFVLLNLQAQRHIVAVLRLVLIDSLNLVVLLV